MGDLPVTQAGFVRVSSNRLVVPEARTPGEALAMLRRIEAVPGHRFWDDATDWTSSPAIDARRLHGHRQVTDAHLLAIALAHGGRLGVLAFDDPDRPIVTSWIELDNENQLVDVRFDSTTAYLTTIQDCSVTCPPLPAWLEVWDVSELDAPSRLGRIFGS